MAAAGNSSRGPGGSRGSWGTKGTRATLRAGWALLALRPGRSGWTGIALRALSGFPACPQSKGQDANQSPAADFHKLSIVEDPLAIAGSTA
jgi:hypothetical protein